MCIIKYSFVLLDRKLDKWYTLAGPANICALRYANEIKLAQWNEQMKQIEKKNWPLWILLSSADQHADEINSNNDGSQKHFATEKKWLEIGFA